MNVKHVNVFFAMQGGIMIMIMKMDIILMWEYQSSVR